MIKKLKRKKDYTRFKDNNWEEDLAEIGLSSMNQGVKDLLCAIKVFAKYACINSLTDKIAKIVLYSFIKIIKKYDRKPNKSWVVQVRELQ